MNGIIIIDKPMNMTSRDVVNIVSKKLNTKKVGHTGTLDPLATGVLVLCIGKATKLVETITAYDKEYIAECVFGVKTDTLDITGNILEKENIIIDKTKVTEVLNSFIGEYEQEVPIYSAVKINGKKLYEYARKNEKVELPKRLVKIKNINLIEITNDITTKIKFRVEVSKGTYIRSLINDIGKKLNTYATMTTLQRTKQGDFTIENSTTIDNINIISIEKILKKYYTVITDENLEKLIKNGVKIQNTYNQEIVFFKNKDNIPLALYKSADNNMLKAWKML